LIWRCRRGASGLDGGFIELIGRPLLNSYRIDGANAQAGAEPVTKILGQQLGLSIDYFNGAFGTVRNAQTATGALVFVNQDDLSHLFSTHTSLHELFSCSPTF
jgi:hypothetical protein